jgi:phosphatidylserine/phosphatidylglycerophosphate/cardiolipin synthase-like enzyme
MRRKDPSFASLSTTSARVFDGPEIVDAFCRKLRDPPHDDFRLVVLLPAKPDNGQDDTRGQLAVLTAADGHAARWLAVPVPSRHGDRTDPLSVHAKVPIVDDDGLIVGSADLNELSLCNDTEMCVADDTQLATAERRRPWAEHLECDESELGGEPVAVIDERWRPIAQDQLERSRDGRPATHRLIELPSVSKRTDRLRGPFAGLFVDG